jgi:hypothetical protein
MIFVINALLFFRVVPGIALAGSFIIVPFNLHAFHRQPVSNPQQENKLVTGVQKIYKITFFSLKRGHSIAPGRMFLYDNGSFEIKIEGENFLKPQGKYAIDGYQFNGEWNFAIKRTRPYQYVSQFKGVNVFNNYIIGLLTLKEYIENQRLTQQIPFIFIAVLEDKNTPPQESENKREATGRNRQAQKNQTFSLQMFLQV